MVKLISFLSILTFSFFFPQEQRSGKKKSTLSIALTNLRNEEGYLYIFIYNYENQYPEKPFKHYKIDKKNVQNSHLLVNIPDLDHGEYAISILDDENENKDMDLFLGIPTEGYAFSNNVRPILSLPDYDELLFDLNTHQRLKLKMCYVL